MIASLEKKNRRRITGTGVSIWPCTQLLVPQPQHWQQTLWQHRTLRVALQSSVSSCKTHGLQAVSEVCLLHVCRFGKEKSKAGLGFCITWALPAWTESQMEKQPELMKGKELLSENQKEWRVFIIATVPLEGYGWVLFRENPLWWGRGLLSISSFLH